MTLSNTLLMPQAFLPLHLCGPKYCKLLNDSLVDHRMFAVALAEKSDSLKQSSTPSNIIGVGLVRACVKNANGAFHVILQGVARAKIIQIAQDAPYSLAHIQILHSTSQRGVETDALMIKVLELILGKAKESHLDSHKMFEFLQQLEDPDILADIVGYNFVNDLQQKQKLLETLDVRQRLRKLLLILDQEALPPSFVRSLPLSPK